MYSINTHLKIQALEIEGMTSEEILVLLPEVRYDNLIRSIERLVESGLVVSPPMEELKSSYTRNGNLKDWRV